MMLESLLDNSRDMLLLYIALKKGILRPMIHISTIPRYYYSLPHHIHDHCHNEPVGGCMTDIILQKKGKIMKINKICVTFI